MATSYPTGLDSFSTPASTDSLDSPDHTQTHLDVHGGVEALEAKVGVNSSAVTTSHDYKLQLVTGTDQAAPADTSGDLQLSTNDKKRNVSIPATAMWETTTSGCAALAKTELATNDVDIQTLDFDQTTQEYAQFAFVMPDNWDASTVTYKAVWTAASGSGDVVWELQGRSYADDDAIDQAWGTAVEVTDTLTATDDICTTSESAAVTLAGTPAAGEYVHFRISRDAANGSDTLSGDAKLIGIRIEYSVSQLGG